MSPTSTGTAQAKGTCSGTTAARAAFLTASAEELSGREKASGFPVQAGYVVISVALTEAQIRSPGLEGEGVESGGGDLGDEGYLSGEADADAVGLAVDVGDGGRPHVARAAFGGRWVEGDGVRLDHGEGFASDGVGGDDVTAGGAW